MEYAQTLCIMHIIKLYKQQFYLKLKQNLKSLQVKYRSDKCPSGETNDN